jgi:hypothetical protein
MKIIFSFEQFYYIGHIGHMKLRQEIIDQTSFDSVQVYIIYRVNFNEILILTC